MPAELHTVRDSIDHLIDMMKGSGVPAEAVARLLKDHCAALIDNGITTRDIVLTSLNQLLVDHYV